MIVLITSIPVKAEFVKNKLEYTDIKDPFVKSEIYYDYNNNAFETNIEDDVEMLKVYKEFIDLNDDVDTIILIGLAGLLLIKKK